MELRADHEIYRRRPDIIVVQEDKNLCQIIDFACRYDGRVDTKELKKNRKLPIIPDKIVGTKWNNPVKLDRRRKVWYLLLRVF